MLCVGGLLYLIGLYEAVLLPLWSEKIQRRRRLGGHYGQTIGGEASRRTMELLGRGVITTERMTTHRSVQASHRTV